MTPKASSVHALLRLVTSLRCHLGMLVVVPGQDHVIDTKVLVLLVRSVVRDDLHVGVVIGRVDVLQVRVGHRIVQNQGKRTRSHHDLLQATEEFGKVALVLAVRERRVAASRVEHLGAELFVDLLQETLHSGESSAQGSGL